VTPAAIMAGNPPLKKNLSTSSLLQVRGVDASKYRWSTYSRLPGTALRATGGHNFTDTGISKRFQLPPQFRPYNEQTSPTEGMEASI
jgi:hypothetical protein